MGLPNHCLAGIKAARPAAERALALYLQQFDADAEYGDTVPGLKAFAAALLDGGAAACCTQNMFSDRESAERFLQNELIPEILAQITPEHGLADALGNHEIP